MQREIRPTDPRERHWATPRSVASLAYFCFASACILVVARIFYSSLKLQLFYSSVRGDPYLLPGEWSAPLDDVFIHFDFARSAARGHPFEWSAGNGYSSGGTSLLYPLALAPGIFLGFRGERLMHFAATVACTSVFATLLASRRLFRGLPRWTEFLAPPLLLSVGALDWSLFSGMEVAFFLAIWSLALVAWDDLVHGPSSAADSAGYRGEVELGLANAVLVATRPEAIVVALSLGVFAALAVTPRRGVRRGLATLGLSVVFAALVLSIQAIANRVLTGDFSASGAIVKLEMNDPRLTRQEVWSAWLFHVRYQIGRVTGYHLGDGLVWGSLFWIVAALPLLFEKTRRYAALLWTQAILWVLVVALNGQVRWQNERYTMPALAWMLLSAALGIGAACSHGFRGRRHQRAYRVATVLAVVAVTFVLGLRQVPKMRDQAWFFGRASRNIYEQHVKVGRRIRREMPSARRVLVGDAGAIPYASDLPALDIIGLGGYPGLPFARATRWGVAAAIELIQRMPSAERPNVMAIYPGWWGDMPAWFGRALDGVSVRGNVICGGLTKMIYRAHWEVLDSGRLPVAPLPDGEKVVDDVDFGDVISEADHGYRITGAPGFVAMKLLLGTASAWRAGSARLGPTEGARRRAVPAALDGAVDDSAALLEGGIWDAGRVVPPFASVRFVSKGLSPGKRARLIIRTAPPQPAMLRVEVDGTTLPLMALKPADSWYEASIEVPEHRVGGAIALTITVFGNEVVLYHLWSIQRR